VPPAERARDVPAAVSAIVLKLLAKTPEDRYQTAAGVEHDLRRCLTDWETLGRIDPFPLGGRDTPDRLRIPETLYGREREVAALLGAFDRVVAGGAPALVLVSGYSGVGKSSVVHELHRVLVPPRGLFAAGKFDQYQRDVPYGTLVQALRGLVRPLLGKREAELAPWRDALREALGTSGRLMADLVPELELVTEAILLVEDEWPVRSLARAALQRYGYSVVEADCAAAALDAWLERRGAVDLLVTDLVMPGGMTGLELADALRARAPGLKVLFMSGYSADAIGRVVQVASPDALLRKPFGAAELAERVRRVLDAVGTGSAPGE
jgi:CheY-like chemotaxis protein